MPFIMGLEKSMFHFAVQYLEENTNIYLVFIEDQKIEISNNINNIINNKSNNKKKVEFKDIINNLPKYPKESYDHLYKELKAVYSNKNLVRIDNLNYSKN